MTFDYDSRVVLARSKEYITQVLFRFHGHGSEVSHEALKAVLGPSLYEEIVEDE